MKLKGIIISIAAVALAVTACKPTEESYRKAYETAKNRDTDPIEETIYNKIRQRARPQQMVVGADTLDYKVEPVTLTDSGAVIRKYVKPYNIVVGQFKQIFNAKAMRDRLIAQDYKAFIVNTAEPLYYVVATTCETPAEALKALNSVKSDSGLILRDPFPWVLHPTIYR